MRILVTGATGFIGKHVIRELLKTQHEIIATAIEKDFSMEISEGAKFRYIQCDLNDTKDDYFTFFDCPDSIIHLSWQGLPNYNKLFHFERNLFSNYFFLKNLIQNGLRDLNVIGTCFEYGMKNGCLMEDRITEPGNSYALAKDVLHSFLIELNKNYEFSLKWIRLFYLYGEGQNKKSLIEQLKIAIEAGEDTFNMSPGDQLRDYLTVEKVAEYIVKISLQKEILGCVNCCSGSPISVRSLVENYIKSNGKEIKLNLGYYSYPDYEPMAFWGSTQKLNKILELYKEK